MTILAIGIGIIGIWVGRGRLLAIGVCVARAIGSTRSVRVKGGWRMVVAGGKGARRHGRLFDNTDIDDHLVAEVLVAGNHCVAGFVFKADAL